MPQPPAGLRSQDLVFTLYGDYLLDRAGPVATGSLIALLGQLGLSAPATRTTLSRLARRGWLTATRRGNRSWYGLTARGRKLLEAGRERIYHPPLRRAWDRRWTVVTYTIPEARRRRRDALRMKLKWLGLGPLGHGLWITPHDATGDVRAIAAELRLDRQVEVFRGTHEGLSPAGSLVEACWDLGALDARYAAFISRWQPNLTHCRHCGMTGAKAGVHRPCTTAADCFRRRFALVHEYRTFPLDDPYLPDELLPAGWHGHEAARLFETYHDTLAPAAERYVADVCRQGDAAAQAA